MISMVASVSIKGNNLGKQNKIHLNFVSTIIKIIGYLFFVLNEGLMHRMYSVKIDRMIIRLDGFF
jgi:hypothetical protein